MAAQSIADLLGTGGGASGALDFGQAPAAPQINGGLGESLLPMIFKALGIGGNASSGQYWRPQGVMQDFTSALNFPYNGNRTSWTYALPTQGGPGNTMGQPGTLSQGGGGQGTSGGAPAPGSATGGSIPALGTGGGLGEQLRQQNFGIAQHMQQLAKQFGIQQGTTPDPNARVASRYVDTGREAPPGQAGEYDPSGPNARYSTTGNYYAKNGVQDKFIYDPKLGQMRDPAQSAAAEAYYASLPGQNPRGYINGAPLPGRSNPTNAQASGQVMPGLNFPQGQQAKISPSAPAGAGDPNSPNYFGRPGNDRYKI